MGHPYPRRMPPKLYREVLRQYLLEHWEEHFRARDYLDPLARKRMEVLMRHPNSTTALAWLWRYRGFRAWEWMGWIAWDQMEAVDLLWFMGDYPTPEAAAAAISHRIGFRVGWERLMGMVRGMGMLPYLGELLLKAKVLAPPQEPWLPVDPKPPYVVVVVERERRRLLGW